jgi:hypothetical protein
VAARSRGGSEQSVSAFDQPVNRSGTFCLFTDVDAQFVTEHGALTAGLDVCDKVWSVRGSDGGVVEVVVDELVAPNGAPYE